MTRRSRSKYSGGPNTIGGQFTSHRVDMVASPAWRALSLSARRCLERIELELAKHGGKENGNLKVSNRRFRDHGVSMSMIKPALAELVALGFIEMTPGYACKNPDYGRSAQFRTLSCNSRDGQPPEHWRRFKTDEEAKLIGKLARASAMQKRRPKARSHASPDASQSEAMAIATESEAMSPFRKVKQCDPSQCEAMSTLSATGRRNGAPPDASEAPPATAARDRAKPKRSGSLAAAMPAAPCQRSEAEPDRWTPDPP
jgi:hypothetical protein